jgi:hypothetical protein
MDSHSDFYRRALAANPRWNGVSWSMPVNHFPGLCRYWSQDRKLSDVDGEHGLIAGCERLMKAAVSSHPDLQKRVAATQRQKMALEGETR